MKKSRFTEGQIMAILRQAEGGSRLGGLVDQAFEFFDTGGDLL